jgi:predicted CoA-binding protein
MDQQIQRFFASPAFAVVGVSASRRKFGNAVYRAMRDRGLTVYPVHRSLDRVEGDACFHSVLEIPGEVQSVVTVVPPAETERVIEECAQKGVGMVWMQKGSESERAGMLAARHEIGTVRGQCIMMFLEPVKSVHSFHRWVNRLVGAYPQ